MAITTRHVALPTRGLRIGIGIGIGIDIGVA